MLISLTPIQLAQPNLDCAEISLFGPGTGECIIIHYGNGRWFIVDSCLCPETKQPISLTYLQSLGVDVARQVTGILITHWHADHIRGASTLVKVCEDAQIYFSGALRSNEALHIAALYNNDMFAGTDKEIKEFGEIVSFLRENGNPERLDPVKIGHTFFDNRCGIHSRMYALSPSTTAVTQSTAKLLCLSPKTGSKRRKYVVPECENMNAVALYLSFGEFSALLGSDLEDTGNIRTGWSAIFESGIVEKFSLRPSPVYKVAHHGSRNGHHDRIWADLLAANPLSIATPYAPSGLPKQDQIDKIKGLSSQFLLTRDPKAQKKPKRESMVERELKSVVKSRRIISARMGHIQIRVLASGDFSVATSDNCASFSNRN